MIAGIVLASGALILAIVPRDPSSLGTLVLLVLLGGALLAWAFLRPPIAWKFDSFLGMVGGGEDLRIISFGYWQRPADRFRQVAEELVVRRARKGRPLPAPRCRPFEGALKLANTICLELETNPVDWFTGGNGDTMAGCRSLDAIHNIGPKIASFILRDLSFMRARLLHGRRALICSLPTRA